MICNFWPKWDIISYLISQKFQRYYIPKYIPTGDIISDIDMKRYISFPPLPIGNRHACMCRKINCICKTQTNFLSHLQKYIRTRRPGQLATTFLQTGLVGLTLVI